MADIANSSDPKIWWEMAINEYEYATHDLEDQESKFFALTCFHFQQAAEKSLKAFILSRSGTFRKVHNLTELAKTCSEFDLDFKNLAEETAILNPFYTETRYPLHWPIGITLEDTRKGQSAAEKILELVKSKI